MFKFLDFRPNLLSDIKSDMMSVCIVNQEIV